MSWKLLPARHSYWTYRNGNLLNLTDRWVHGKLANIDDDLWNIFSWMYFFICQQCIKRLKEGLASSLGDLSRLLYCNLLLVTGEYSCLTVDLTFKREFSYYLLTIYVPCCMLVIVSWVNTPLLFSRRGLTFEETNQTARWASGWTPTQCLLESLLESPPCSPCPHSRFLTLIIIITLHTQQLSSCSSSFSE